MPEEIITYSYIQKCYTLGSLFVGLTGGLALGYLTHVHTTKPLFMISTLPQVQPYIKKFPQLKCFLGANSMCGRLAIQGVGTAFAYSFLECRFQKGHPRSFVDAGLAAGITGGGFGMRGIPGGSLGSAYGAGGFALYAILMHYLFRR